MPQLQLMSQWLQSLQSSQSLQLLRLVRLLPSLQLVARGDARGAFAHCVLCSKQPDRQRRQLRLRLALGEGADAHLTVGHRVARSPVAGSPGRQVAGSPRRQVASVSDCALRAP